MRGTSSSRVWADLALEQNGQSLEPQREIHAVGLLLSGSMKMEAPFPQLERRRARGWRVWTGSAIREAIMRWRSRQWLRWRTCWNLVCRSSESGHASGTVSGGGREESRLFVACNVMVCGGLTGGCPVVGNTSRKVELAKGRSGRCCRHVGRNILGVFHMDTYRYGDSIGARANGGRRYGRRCRSPGCPVLLEEAGWGRGL